MKKKPKKLKVSKRNAKIETVDELFTKDFQNVKPLFEFLLTKLKTIGSFDTIVESPFVAFRRSNVFALIKVSKNKLELGFYANKKLPEFKSAKNWKEKRITHKIDLIQPSDLTPSVMEALRYAYLIAAAIRED